MHLTIFPQFAICIGATEKLDMPPTFSAALGTIWKIDDQAWPKKKKKIEIKKSTLFGIVWIELEKQLYANVATNVGKN